MTEKLKKHKVLLVIILLVIIIAISTIVIINTKKSSTSPDANQQQQSTITLKKMDLTTSISATGTIESNQSKTVSANINDITVKKVNVSVGDSVKKGDVLVTFDESDLQDALADAQESLSDAQTDSANSISSAKKQLSDAQSTYSEEKTKLDKEVASAKKVVQQARNKVKQLKKQVAAANSQEKQQLKEQLTAANEALKQAKSSYETAVSNRDNTNKQNKSNITNAQDAVTNAESSGKKSINEAQSQVEEAQKNLEKCNVTAPISGTVTAVNIENNDTYSGGDMFQIDDTSSFTVTTSVDEYDISSVSVGQRVVILTEATDEDEIEGNITFVAPSTSSTSSTQSNEGSSTMSSSTSSDGYEVDIAITSTDDRLKMGLTAKCSIILEEVNDVFAVPYDAIHKNSNGDNVIYVAEDNNNEDNSSSNSYKEVTVTKGMESDYYVEISGDELSEGLQVVIPTDETSSDSKEDSSENMLPGLGGGNGGDMPNSGNNKSGGSRPDGGNGGKGGGAPNM